MERLVLRVALLPILVQASLNAAPEVGVVAESLVAAAINSDTPSHNSVLLREVQREDQSNELTLTATTPQAEQLAGPGALRSAVFVAPVHSEALSEEKKKTSSSLSSSPSPVSPSLQRIVSAAAVQEAPAASPAAPPPPGPAAIADEQPPIVTTKGTPLRGFGTGSGNSLLLEPPQTDAAPPGPARIVQSVQQGFTAFGAAAADAAAGTPSKLENSSGAIAAAVVGAPLEEAEAATGMVSTTASPARSAAGERPTFRLLHAALLFVVVPLVMLLSKAGIVRTPCSFGKARHNNAASEETARAQRARDWIEAWRASKDQVDQDLANIT